MSKQCLLQKNLKLVPSFLCEKPWHLGVMPKNPFSPNKNEKQRTTHIWHAEVVQYDKIQVTVKFHDF